MKKISTYIILSVICAILGFAIVLQIRSVRQSENVVQDTQIMRAETLQTEVTKLKNDNEALYKQLLQYKDDLQKFRDEAASSSDYAGILNQQLTKAEVLAGLVDVEGPGVIVTMKDNPNYVGDDQNLFIIHDEDILNVINELRDSGAEALSLNEERILSTSEIRCAGATVSINNNRYAAPYVIKAIGSADTMEAALKMSGGVIDILSKWGIEVTVEKKDNITVKAYGGAIQYKYATVVDKGGK